MNTGVGNHKDIKTPWVIEQHEVLKVIMKVAQRKLVERKRKGMRFKQLADTFGVPKQRISEVYHGKMISKKMIKLLIAYDIIKLDDILPEISKEQISCF